MPYIGRELDRGNYLKLDDISSSFNGSTTTFNLTNGGKAFYPGSAFSILVVLAGVIQEPEAAYQINQTQITFASAPLAGDQFFCITLGVALGVNTPANGSVNGTQLAKPFNYDNYFYLDDANNRVGVGTATPMTPLHVEGTGRFTNVTVTGDLTVEGTTTTLDTVVTEVDKLEVGANNNTVGVAITQSGSGDILRLFDGASEVFSVADGGAVKIGGAGQLALDVSYDGSNATAAKIVTNTGITNANSTFTFAVNENSGAQMQLKGDGAVIFSEGSTERLRITSGGNIGVGEASPDVRLHVKEQFDTAYSLAEMADEANHLLKLENPSSTANAFAGMQFRVGSGADLFFGAIQQSINHGDFFFGNQNSPNKEMMRIKSTGLVGIGTDDPQSLLEVFGTSPIIRSKHSTSQKYTQINHNGTDGYVDWSSGHLIFRGASNTERLRITSGGGLKFISADSPTSTTEPAQWLNHSGGMQLYASSGTSTHRNIIFCSASNAASERLRITSTGTVKIGSNTLITPSTDADNFVIDTGDVDSGLSILSATTGRIYFGDAASTDQGSIRYVHTDDSMRFETNSSEKLRIKSDGKLMTQAAGYIYTTSSAGSLSLYGGNTNLGGGIVLSGGNTNGDIRFYAQMSTSSPEERLRITSDGKLGLGETTPDFKFHSKETGGSTIAGLFETNQTDSYISFQASGTTASSTVRIGAVADNFVAFINGAERLRITSTGDITIGSAGSSLYFQNGFNNSASRIQNGGASNSANLKFYVRDSGTESEHMRLTEQGGLSICREGTLNTTAGNETLYIQGEGHNGHGTGNTRSVVSIIGAISSNNSGAGLWIGARTNENTAVIGTRTASGNLAFETYSGGWDERMRLTNTGQLLVAGTVVQGHGNMDDLQVGNGSGNRGITISSGTSNYGTVAFGDSTDGSGTDRYEGFVEYYHSDNSMRLGTVHQERLRINSAGHVGIDCTPNDHNNFTRALDVNGPSGAAVYMRTNDSTSNCFIVGNYGSEAYINNVANGNIRFYTQGTERFRISNTGLVGVNTTSPSVSLDLSNNTDAVALPTGTTAQRPSGTDAYIRKNSTNNALEFYNGTEWVEIITDYFPTGSTILG